MLSMHYFGTYSRSSNLSERLFRPSWRSPQGWCVFQAKCPKKFEAELISVDFGDCVDGGFNLHNNRLPWHIANRYLDGVDSFSFNSTHFYDESGNVTENSKGYFDVIDDSSISSLSAFANVSLIPVRASDLSKEELVLLKEAQKKEFDAYKRNDVYKLVPFSEATTKPIPSSMRNFKKLISDAFVSDPVYKFKSRLVINGTVNNGSREDLDGSTAMPPIEAFRAFLSVACRRKGFQPPDLQQADVVTAFLQAELKSELPVFGYPPREHPDYGKGVWLMKKAGNGLRDSPRCWFVHSESILMKLGWERTIFDDVYIRMKNGLLDGILLLWVDDILACSGVTKAVDILKELGRFMHGDRMSWDSYTFCWNRSTRYFEVYRCFKFQCS